MPVEHTQPKSNQHPAPFTQNRNFVAQSPRDHEPRLLPTPRTDEKEERARLTVLDRQERMFLQDERDIARDEAIAYAAQTTRIQKELDAARQARFKTSNGGF